MGLVEFPPFFWRRKEHFTLVRAKRSHQLEEKHDREYDMHDYDPDLGLFYGGKIKKAEKMKKESAVFTDEILYGKTPQTLLRDPKLKPQAKAL